MATATCSTKSKSERTERESDEGEDHLTPMSDKETGEGEEFLETNGPNDTAEFSNKLTENSQIEYIDGEDKEYKSTPVHIVSLNQDDGVAKGHFLRLRSQMVNGKITHIVTADGEKGDKEAQWTSHVHQMKDGHLVRKIVILENFGCSNDNEKYILCVKKTEKGQHTLSVKKIKKVPEIFIPTNKSIHFFQNPRATGSEWAYFESTVRPSEKRLLIGFDTQGQPKPMEEVTLHSRHFEAYFKITRLFN